MVELNGSLSGIGLLAVVQLIDEVHHSGNLELRSGPLSGTLAFDDGRLVAAEYGDHHGLDALAKCVQELAEGEFTFIEGLPTLERTLDLSPADLKKLVDRIASGEFQAHANGVNGAGDADGNRPETICPLLGFADDRSRHYSRATALHRCYAGGGPSLVSAQEQRDLCLSGRFATCPRFRNAEPARPAAVPQAEPTIIDATPPPPTPIRPVAALQPALPPEPAAPAIPPGVARRLAASANMRMSAEAAPPAAEKPAEKRPVQEEKERPGRPPRGVMVIVGGAVLGFLLVGLVMLVILPRLRPVAAPQASNTAFEQLQPTRAVPPTAVATQPAPTAAVITAGARATQQPTPTPFVFVAPAQQPKPTAAPTIQTGPNSLVDVRFAAGPVANWVDNQPYASWSDGAYRLRARDPARFVAVGIPLDRVMSDVVVSATFRKTGGPPGGGYGLIVRDQGPEPRDGVNQEMTAYVVETGDLGEYGIWRRDGDHWVDLVPWTRSASVRSGGSPNELSVQAVGTQLSFTVNGAIVATVSDSSLGDGGVGLFAGGDNNEVAVDHFSVQLPN